MSRREVTIEDLQRLHKLAAQRFPHEYLDEGLGAVGLFLHDPPENAGYSQTPVNSVTFAGAGVDGIHFGCVTDSSTIDPQSAVVVTIPMAFDQPNYIIGESLYDFLCLGCRHGYSGVANLHLNQKQTLEAFSAPPAGWFDDRAPQILELLTDELSLEPWPNVEEHFHDLQTRFMPSLKLKDCC